MQSLYFDAIKRLRVSETRARARAWVRANIKVPWIIENDRPDCDVFARARDGKL